MSDGMNDMAMRDRERGVYCPWTGELRPPEATTACAEPDAEPHDAHVRDYYAQSSPFERVGAEMGRLVAEKNAAYGDSFARSGALLRELYPDGVRVEQYQDMLAIVRVIDKLFRIATRKDAFGESPWRDIVGYGILSVATEGHYAERAA